jgi:cytochrome c553
MNTAKSLYPWSFGLAFTFCATVLSTPVVAAAPGENVVKISSGAIAMCIGCHGIEGYKASFPAVYSVPKISGQSQKYIENALQAYRKGDRTHPTMRAIAGSLSDADITALAVYYSKNLVAGGSAK